MSSQCGESSQAPSVSSFFFFFCVLLIIILSTDSGSTITMPSCGCKEKGNEKDNISMPYQEVINKIKREKKQNPCWPNLFI